jgi:hypothetical protein
MAVNKVVYNQSTLIDLTSDTVTEDTLLKGCTAHKSDGTIVTGKMFEGYPSEYILYESIRDSSGDSIADNLNSVIQGKTVYKKV